MERGSERECLGVESPEKNTAEKSLDESKSTVPCSYISLAFGTKRMDLKVTSPSAAKWIFARGS